MTRLCVLITALAVIARTRVPVLPGWVVPLPVLIVAAVLALSAATVAWIVVHSPRTWPPHGGTS